MKNELFELASRRRSVRQYGDKKIDDQVIDEIMKVALTAPSSFGHRPVEYVVVRDKETIKDWSITEFRSAQYCRLTASARYSRIPVFRMITII